MRCNEAHYSKLFAVAYARRVYQEKKDLSSGRIDRKGVLRCHHRVYLTPKFFESVKSNIALERLRQYLKGKGRLVAIRAENKRVEEDFLSFS